MKTFEKLIVFVLFAVSSIFWSLDSNSTLGAVVFFVGSVYLFFFVDKEKPIILPQYYGQRSMVAQTTKYVVYANVSTKFVIGDKVEFHNGTVISLSDSGKLVVSNTDPEFLFYVLDLRGNRLWPGTY